ncbi:MAG: hypothetical protein HQ494_16540 [Rhodospirillales bacterium]|nr:hypothetical protein [Rhodospirillales bacterium]
MDKQIGDGAHTDEEGHDKDADQQACFGGANKNNSEDRGAAEKMGRRQCAQTGNDKTDKNSAGETKNKTAQAKGFRFLTLFTTPTGIFYGGPCLCAALSIRLFSDDVFADVSIDYGIPGGAILRVQNGFYDLNGLNFIFFLEYILGDRKGVLHLVAMETFTDSPRAISLGLNLKGSF